MNLREIYRRMVEAYNARDLQAIMEAYAEDAELIVPGWGTLKGEAAIREFWTQERNGYPTARVRELAAAESESTVLQEWELVTKHTGSVRLPTGETRPPTNRDVIIRGAVVINFEGDRIKTHRFYFDNGELARQLGLTLAAPIPAPKGLDE